MVTETVPVGEITGSFPAVEQEVGSLQSASEVLIRFPEQIACHTSDHTLVSLLALGVS